MQGALTGVKENVVGRLEARGDVHERKGVEGRKEIRHVGKDGVKNQHLEKERVTME